MTTRESSLIYLDGFATTPLAPEARAAMMEAWDRPGNAGSPHAAGAWAASAVARARTAVAALIGAAPAEVIFTSGATEANNLALLGVARRAGRESSRRRRIIVSAIEHKAVLEPAAALEREGFEVVLAPVDRHGRLDLAAYAGCLTSETLMVSVMAANNETGALQPIAEVVALAHEAGALVHCDAAQAAGKMPIDVVELDVDYLSLSAHKLYGPMGVGALYVSATAPTPEPLQRGGGQEQGVRSGTEPVPLLAGFGAAAALARTRLDEDRQHGEALARRLIAGLGERQVRFDLITGTHSVLPGALSLMLSEVEADEIVERLSASVYLTTGSACTSGQIVSSHVLKAMSLDEASSRRVLRVFCGRYNTEADVDQAAAQIATAVRRSALAPGEVHQ